MRRAVHDTISPSQAGETAFLHECREVSTHRGQHEDSRQILPRSRGYIKLHVQ
ncbi:hypothetical protein JG687_00011783 [Phytophthora cactorum]|uniref:Uncharacterized protein n=1 Tax=Phytophthora cactorum TaxID=29920 RepID=A0A8T1U3M7_9STRA|nr:hypothetical protein JG687_00011783 [Phytophthora cactorum]